MKKNIGKNTWSQIKGQYVAGKDTVTKIAEDHGIHRKSIQRKAKKEGWVYGSSKDSVSEAIESATIETIIGTDVDKAVIITQKFIDDSSNIRNITMAILSGMAKTLKKEGGNIKADEANRLLSCQRVIETTMKTITGNYNAVRKALGMDSDDKIKESIRMQEKLIQQQKNDPLEGVSEEELDKEIAKLDD